MGFTHLHDSHAFYYFIFSFMYLHHFLCILHQEKLSLYWLRPFNNSETLFKMKEKSLSTDVINYYLRIFIFLKQCLINHMIKSVSINETNTFCVLFYLKALYFF
jgi:hypothetical protein